MSGDKRIYITVDSTQIDELKAEIKEYVIAEVDSAITKKMQGENSEKEMQKLEENVQNIFKNGAKLKNQAATDRDNSTPLKIDGSIREICEMQRDGKWVSEVKVKVVDVENYEEEADRRLQTGVMVDLADDWKFKFIMWRKSGLRMLNVGQLYELKDVVSSVYGDPPKVEIQLNSKSEIIEVYEEGLRDLL